MEPSSDIVDRLAAALMLVDPSATVVARAPRVIELKLGTTGVVLIDAREPETFDADVMSLAAPKPGAMYAIVGVVTGGAPDAAFVEVLRRRIPSSLLQLRGARMAFVWAPGAPPVAVRGALWRQLTQAIKRVEAGEVGDATAITAERGAQIDEVRGFMVPLLQRKPFVTWAVAGLSVALFGLQMLWGDGAPYVSGLRMGASLPSLIAEGQLWRLLAPMLLHGSVVHLALNMLALFSFGTFLERFLGWRRYLLLYVLSGLGGGIASSLRADEVISVGASGGIWGLMLAGAVLVTWPRGKLPAMVSAVQRQRAWTPVAINLAYSFTPGIDMLAHVGGGLVGGLLVLSGLVTAGIPLAGESNDAQRPPRRESIVISVASALCGAALLGSLIASLATGRPWELQSAPTMHVMTVKDAEVRVPTLLSTLKAQPDGQTFGYGALTLDPVAFMFVFTGTVLTDEELADAEGQFHDAVESFKPMKSPDFSEAVATEVRHADGRPYLFYRQTTADGRTGDGYLVLVGNRVVAVYVFASSNASGPWREAAASVPFSIRFP